MWPCCFGWNRRSVSTDAQPASIASSTRPFACARFLSARPKEPRWRSRDPSRAVVWPRRCDPRDARSGRGVTPSPRNILAAPAASPRSPTRDAAAREQRHREMMHRLAPVPAARAGPDRTFASRPRRRRDSAPRDIRVASATSPRLGSAEYPRRVRGVAATCLRKIHAAKLHVGLRSVDEGLPQGPAHRELHGAAVVRPAVRARGPLAEVRERAGERFLGGLQRLRGRCVPPCRSRFPSRNIHAAPPGGAATRPRGRSTWHAAAVLGLVAEYPRGTPAAGPRPAPRGRSTRHPAAGPRPTPADDPRGTPRRGRDPATFRRGARRGRSCRRGAPAQPSRGTRSRGRWSCPRRSPCR